MNVASAIADPPVSTAIGDTLLVLKLAKENKERSRDPRSAIPRLEQDAGAVVSRVEVDGEANRCAGRYLCVGVRAVLRSRWQSGGGKPHG